MLPDRLEGCLTGIALGDSLGLPMEAIKGPRSRKMFHGRLRQRMIAGRGLLSDDTLMAVATVIALNRSPEDSEQFTVELGRLLRAWFWTIPPGIGLATLRSCLKLTLGSKASRSGVFSAGNGAAIRAVVLGCIFSSAPERRLEFITASTRVTHTHPLAENGSQLAGLAAAMATNGDVNSFRAAANELVPDWPWSDSYPDNGPTGFIVHTMNAAIECWQRYPSDIEKSLTSAISLGGDTDSVAAIVGGLVGASRDCSKPRSIWFQWIGWPQRRDLHLIANARAKKLPVLRLAAQHAFGLAVILPHALRRLLPPY